jgi:anaerobic magnesium-protoporphyrin IX monomethyl ester cyclase
MIDVLLAHSNHIFYDRKQVQKMQPYPPLETLLSAAVLRQAGFSVALCDVSLSAPEEAFEKAIEDHQPRLIVVCEDGFNFLSKMCLLRNRELAFSMAAAAHSRSIRIAVHSPDASDHIAEYLRAGFDYVLLGEVEATLVELASGAAPHQINGLAYPNGAPDIPHYNAPRILRDDLNSLPQPAWDLVDMKPYRQAWLSAHGYFSLNMISSRGCPFRCNWCAKPVYGNSYRVRDARLVADEMRFLKDRFAPDQIWFADDIFALSPRWASEFSEAVVSNSAQIPFKMQSRCDLMTRETVGWLRQAGCAEVWMGAESGSQKILDAMEKGIKVEDIYRARENLSRHGIRACLFLQFGYPGESWNEIEATIRMVRDVQPDDIGISVSYPLPGTRFFQLVSQQLSKRANWSESGDLSMMFQGAYRTDFYRALADALHLEVRGGGEPDALRVAWQRVDSLCGESTALKGVCQ